MENDERAKWQSTRRSYVAWRAAARGSSVLAIERALNLLDAFGLEDAKLTLAELSRRAHLPKSSALRIARTLQRSGYLVQLPDVAWRLGPAAAWLGARYQVVFDLDNTIEPVLQDLARKTRESASFFVRDGEMRICLLRVKGNDAPHRVRIGEPLPLEKGSAGQVMLAFTGREGSLYEEIRQRGFHITIGEFSRAFASVSAPVFGRTWSSPGALCVAGPVHRLTKAKLDALAPIVMRAAHYLSCEMSRLPFSPRLVVPSARPSKPFT